MPDKTGAAHDHDPCPCGVGACYGEHCGAIHSGGRARTAEDLMRSRYSAHVLGLADYLRRSWHPDTCPPDVTPDMGLTWTGLTIQRTERGGALDAEGVVEFTATHERAGRPGELHEISRFTRLGMRWVYHDGSHPL